MSSNEPWVSLGRTYEYSIAKVHNILSELYVAKIDNEIVGCIMIQMHGELKGYIRCICVDPAYQGRSIGRKMINMIEKRIFQESPNVFMTVSSFNTRAKELYERIGYHEVGVFKDYIIEGSDEILLRKTIGPSDGFEVKYPYYNSGEVME